MNNRGQTLGMAIIVGIIIFLMGMLFVNFLKPEITTARSITGLNCINASDISDGTKLTCLAVDLVVPYFMILVIAASGGMILSRFAIGR